VIFRFFLAKKTRSIDPARHMLKASFLLAGLFISTLSMAGPKIGDSVTYGLTHEQDGKINGTYTLMNQITAIDKAGETASVLQTISQNETLMSRQTISTPLSQIAYPNEATIATCGKVSYPGQTGTPETITVPAGRFKTCHIVLDQSQNGQMGEYYAAAVPFGFVKSVSTNTMGTMTSVLISFLKK
jgi:hypothetical protein